MAIRLVDERPPEYAESTVEGDLAMAAEAGGLTDIDEAHADDLAVGVLADRDVVQRTQAWLADHPEAVQR